MPFTSKEDQAAVEANGGFPITVGDMCREAYIPMVKAWKAEPRWRTAHNIYKSLLDQYPIDEERLAARSLAWQVFFIKYVWPYEQKAIERNGDITGDENI